MTRRASWSIPGWTWVAAAIGTVAGLAATAAVPGALLGGAAWFVAAVGIAARADR